jgi:ferredoxin
MKVVVDKELCTGCGLCASTCPDVYEMEENVAVVKADPVPDAQEQCAKEAVEGCPVEAIRVE